MMYYIYILHSSSADKYYIGYTENYLQRLNVHNTTDRNTWTKKYRPWIIAAVFEAGDNRSEAMKAEKFIKKQKSSVFLKKMISGEPMHGILSRLVRVPRT